MSLVLQPLLPFPNSCQGTSPHQQGRGTKMTEHCYCGIDVAKDRLDVQVLPHRQRFSVDNSATGWAELVDGPGACAFLKLILTAKRVGCSNVRSASLAPLKRPSIRSVARS